MSDDPQSNLQVTTQVTPDKDLSFRISGTGVLTDQQQGQGGQQQADTGGAMGGGAAGRPGGGLGTPEGTPDPIHKYRWAILAGGLALLAAGGGWVATRNQSASASQPAAAAVPKPVRAAAPKPARAAAPQPAPASLPGPLLQTYVPQSGMLLQGLKEELFQLEIERQQGRITEEEYLQTKAALDQTLRRALQRAKGLVNS